MLELRAIMHGNVQAVGFRATTCLFARELRLKGIVRNRSDGTVEVVAQGEKKNLEELIAKLKRDFQIKKADIQYVKPEKSYEGFSAL